MQMTIKRSEPIWSLAWNPNPLPSKSDTINAQEALSVACWDQTLSFYGINGQQIGKDKKLGFDPLCISFFNSGDFMLVAGTNRKTFLFNREGVKLSAVSEGLSDWIWTCKMRCHPPNYNRNFVLDYNRNFVLNSLQAAQGLGYFCCCGVSCVPRVETVILRHFLNFADAITAPSFVIKSCSTRSMACTSSTQHPAQHPSIQHSPKRRSHICIQHSPKRRSHISCSFDNRYAFRDRMTDVIIQVRSHSSIFLGSLSILVGIIRSIEAYFGWGKRSESHRISSLQYAKTNKLIAVELALQSGDRIAAKDLLNIIKQDLQTLAEYAPMLDDVVIEKFKDLYGKYPTKKSNLTNGLTTIFINNSNHVTAPPDVVIVENGMEL